jgi:hypothetical protein
MFVMARQRLIAGWLYEYPFISLEKQGMSGAPEKRAQVQIFQPLETT